MVELAEFFRIESGTHYYNFEGIRRVCGGFALAILGRVSELLYCFEIGDEQVCPQSPFVRFVDDNDAVAAQHRIRHEFTNYHSVREIFYPRRPGRLLVEANSVSNEVADRPVLFCCNAVVERGVGVLAWLGGRDLPFLASPDSRIYCGTSAECQQMYTGHLTDVRVVFPDPVSPRRIVTSFFRISSIRASLPGSR